MRIIHKIKRYYNCAYRLGHYPSLISLIRNKNKTFIYYGFLGDSNFGDEVVFETSRQLFKPHILLPVKKMMPLPLMIYCKLCNKKISGIIIGGGTLFGSIMEQDFFESIVDTKKPVYIHGTGTHSTMGSLDGWKRILSNRIYGGVRGPISKYNMKNYDFEVGIAGDASFGMFERKLDNGHGKRETLKTILVNVGTHLDFKGSTTSRNAIKGFIKACVRDGFRVQFLPFFSTDTLLGLEIKKEIPEMELLKIPTSYLECVNHFHNSIFAIGERLHFNIMALLGNSPFLSINYNKKHEDFLESMNLKSSGILPEDISLDEALNAFQNRFAFDWEAINKKLYQYKHFQVDEASKFIN